jgi:hypothetical protein
VGGIFLGLTLVMAALAWEAAQLIRGLTQGQALRLRNISEYSKTANPAPNQSIKRGSKLITI